MLASRPLTSTDGRTGDERACGDALPTALTTRLADLALAQTDGDDKERDTGCEVGNERENGAGCSRGRQQMRAQSGRANRSMTHR